MVSLGNMVYQSFVWLNVYIKQHASVIGFWFICLNEHKVCHGHDRMVVGFTTTYAISAYHH
jgi:hypothetical protein